MQDRLTIGAAVSCRTIWEHPEIAERFPALTDAATLIGGIQIQGRATFGGNLCNAAPSADTVPPVIVYGAIAHIISARGERDVPVEEICTGPGRTSLAPDEILVSLSIPAPPANSGTAFLRFIPRNEMDIAVANAAARVDLDEAGTTFKSARIAIGAVAPTPLHRGGSRRCAQRQACERCVDQRRRPYCPGCIHTNQRHARHN